MKKIEDYLHLYIGCDLYSVPQNSEYFIEKLTGVDTDCMRVQDEVVYFPIATDEYKLILRPLSDMTEEEMILIAKNEGYLVKEDVKTEDSIEHIENRILSAKFFPKGTPDPQGVFDPIENDCIGFEVQYLHGVKEGVGEVWSDPEFCAFWDWSSHYSKESFVYLLKQRFDLFGLIEAGLAISTPTIEQ